MFFDTQPDEIRELRKRIERLEIDNATLEEDRDRLKNDLSNVTGALELCSKRSGVRGNESDIRLTVQDAALYEWIERYYATASSLSELRDEFAKIMRQRHAFRELVDRAMKMMWLAIPETREPVSESSHNPVTAWVAQAQRALKDANG